MPIAGNLGPLTSATLAGAPALTADYNGSIASGQIMIVDYGSKTYFIELTAYSSQFAKLRDGDFAAILASWRWH